MGPFRKQVRVDFRIIKKEKAVGVLSLTDNTPVLFAYGEFYCFAVIFATQVLWENRISLCGTAEQYHCPKGNITHRKQKRESFTEFRFHITLSSVFYRQFRIWYTNASGYAYNLILFSDKDNTHMRCFAFFVVGLFHEKMR